MLVDYRDIFARHKMDIGMNREFKVKITPKDNKAVYSQNLPRPIRLRQDLVAEMALMHKYGIITVLPFSKYASAIFAQRKPNEKLRLLVDLRKINTLIADDYVNNIHPVSTFSDAAKHFSGKSLLCKLDCSQSYHCLHMADQRSVEMLAFSFASRTFAYKRLAQGLSRSVSVFFQVSGVSTWTQLSKLTIVLNTWTTLESQPIMLKNSPGTTKQSSSAFAKQDWNWQLKNATLESDKLNSWEEQFHQKESHHKPGKLKNS